MCSEAYIDRVGFPTAVLRILRVWLGRGMLSAVPTSSGTGSVFQVQGEGGRAVFQVGTSEA